ncbi:MAG TPA: nucleotidyltransferase domain-containing protein [Candidatus Nanoarchaeia archaeon]|nr:nucleotidyltransferase domain-containing protein [Candidatus Nanoarchaeia archaeon]
MFDKLNSLRLFFDEPNREFGVREYARTMLIAPATASSRLRDLQLEGYLVVRKDRNVMLYKADSETGLYKDAKIHSNITKIRASGLMDVIIRELHQPLAIFLFGSFAKGENMPGSDIDIFVLAHTKKELKLVECEKKIGAAIHLFVHTPKEIAKLKKTSPNLLNNILNGVRLAGFWEVF